MASEVSALSALVRVWRRTSLALVPKRPRPRMSGLYSGVT